MQFKKLDRRRLSQVIADDLEDAIISGAFEFGARLPSEQSLANQFEVSRNVIREAFKILQERGLIDIQGGSGAYVCHPSSDTLIDAFGRYVRLINADSSIGHLYEARRTLEVTIARLAADRATEQDLEALSVLLNDMREHAGSIEKWTKADLEFHLTLAQFTHNPFFTVLLEPLVDLLRNVISQGYLVPGAADTGLEAHIKMYECLKNRDPDGASQAMKTHLDDSEERITSIEQTSPTTLEARKH